MIARGFRPNGARLTWPTDLKIKCLQVQRKNGETHPSNMYIDWPWIDRLKPQIDIAAALGANCVKQGNGTRAIVTAAITRADHETKMRQFIEYAATRGLYVYWCLHFFEEDLDCSASVATMDEILHTAEVLAQYPNVIGTDISNESLLNVSLATAVNNNQIIYRAVKGSCPRLPLTASLVRQHASEWANNLSDFAPFCDFWDFHPYYVDADPQPAPADLAPFRASRPNYKPWIIGECGAALSEGSTFQTARWDAIGVLSQEPDCMGAVGYTIQDCELPTDFAIYDDSYNQRAYMATSFAGWPGHP